MFFKTIYGISKLLDCVLYSSLRSDISLISQPLQASCSIACYNLTARIMEFMRCK